MTEKRYNVIDLFCVCGGLFLCRKRVGFYLTGLMLLAIAICSCSGRKVGRNSGDLSRLENLRKEAIDAYMRDSIEKSDSLGSILYNEAKSDENEIYETYGLLIRGFAPRSNENADERIKFVREAEKKALALDNDTLLSWVYNVLGIYATTFTFNFSEARHYYAEAIKYAKRGKVNHFRISAECNIAELYYIFGDTLGIKYDLDIYRYSKEVKSPHLLVAASRRIAEYYINRPGMEHRALTYIKDISDAGNVYLSQLVRGKYYHALDSMSQARREFEAALRHDTITPSVYLAYARFLNNNGEYRKSNLYLDTTYTSYKEIEEKGFDYIETMRLYSDNMRNLGNSSKALEYLERYIAARDSVNRLRNREEINSYKVKFDVEKKELELAKNRETMRRQSITIWAVGIVITISVIFFLIYSYRQRSMYRLIVRQHRDFLMPTPKIEEPMEIAAKGGLSADKAEAIWNAIQHEMDDNKIYTDPDVTRDSFSERIGCNHTWFSQVIKDKTGKSYLQFMNARRVNEAVRILSDPANDTPIKSLVFALGFTSISTFYSTFRQQVGMSPAEFRKLSLKE